MEEHPDFIPGIQPWLVQVSENMRDYYRCEVQPGDSDTVIASRKYLEIRKRRLSKQQMGSLADAFPQRIVEIIRGRKLGKMLNTEFGSRNQMDDMLPTLARIEIDQADPL